MWSRKYALLGAAAVLLGIAGTLIWRHDVHADAVATFSKAIAADTSFQGQTAAYRSLLEAIGPSAQETLLALFEPTPRSHMLNHESGIYLYEAEGEHGIYQCKNYFNGSCFHGFVETLLADRGFGVLTSVVDLCREERPLEQARECSHGVGHAFLIAAGYDNLPEAVARCRSTFASSTTAIGDCDDGVFMENNFGGFSVPPDNRWYRAEDPQYPCTVPEIRADTIAHGSCWFMQSQATLNATMYPRFEGKIGNVVSYCADIADDADRRMCDQGLARQIQQRSGDDPDAILFDCSLAYPDAPETCYADAAESAYGFGAETAAIALCEHAGPLADACFETLYERISSTAYHTRDERLRACGRIGEPARIDACTAYAREHSAF